MAEILEKLQSLRETHTIEEIVEELPLYGIDRELLEKLLDTLIG